MEIRKGKAMADFTEHTDSQRYERERRKYRFMIFLTVIIILAAAVCVVLYVINQYLNQTYAGYEVIGEIERQESATAAYLPYNESGFMRYSRDGALAVDSEGNILWNGSYDFNNPAGDTCESFAVIADIGGTKAYVYNGSDSGTEIEVLHPIVAARVANQGVVALLLEDTSSNLIQIYNPYSSSDKLLVEIPTNVQEDGYPVDFDISEDGKRLVISYVNVKKGVEENYLNFYNFDDVGQNSVNRLVGARNFKETLIPKVVFLNNEIVCAFTENGFSLYSMKQIPSDIKEETFDDGIKSVCYDEGHIGFVLEDFNDAVSNKLRVYNTKGVLILDKNIDYSYEELYLSGNEIVFYGSSTCSILRLNGELKFQGEMSIGSGWIFPVDNFEKYTVLGNSGIYRIKLKTEEGSNK